jgi:hypothetical protein
MLSSGGDNIGEALKLLSDRKNSKQKERKRKSFKHSLRFIHSKARCEIIKIKKNEKISVFIHSLKWNEEERDESIEMKS